MNGDDAYKSLADAIAKYPETASAVAAQYRRGRLSILAPIGLTDLVELRLRRNPSAAAAAFQPRRPQIASRGRWPPLEIVDYVPRTCEDTRTEALAGAARILDYPLAP